NLVTKRAVAMERATVEWVDGNIGSKRTMKYPAVHLMGEGAHGEVLSIAFSGKGQEQDTGAKMVHAASNTSSVVTSKSISKDGGTASYRGQVKVDPGLHNIRSHVVCDALILDSDSTSNTYPYMDINSEDVSIEHEARVSRISEEQLFYLMSRGMSEEEASMMIVNGFLDPLVKQLPMEYAVELNRLIELEMEGSVG
ncbi:MAG: SufD family Fe-S cluster assembly protein, partial [Spirochaetota bacterium]